VEVLKAIHTPEVLMSHPNARLTPRGRLLLVEHALSEWLTYYNIRRRHSALGGQAPISRLSIMS